MRILQCLRQVFGRPKIATSVIAAHKHCARHREELLASERCGCFYCLKVFSPYAITDWIEESGKKESTAMCPFCTIDSVIGSKSGYPITHNFLAAMQQHWS